MVNKTVFEFSKSISLLVIIFSVLLLGLIFLAGFSYALKLNSPTKYKNQSNITDSEQQLYLELNHGIKTLQSQLSKLENDMLRLDAIGKQLITQAQLDEQEFDFSSQLSLSKNLEENNLNQGGELIALNLLKGELGADLVNSSLSLNLTKQYQLIAELVATRLEQFESLQDLFNLSQLPSDHKFSKLTKLVDDGWVSSGFGIRKDPFTGKQAVHSGIDIAGKEGSLVRAAAKGVVSFADQFGNYGKMVEIKHPNGLTTRYAHNQEFLVKIGDLVESGDQIAKLGNTGRSTGPHLHFEVRKDGKAVNPSKYIEKF